MSKYNSDSSKSVIGQVLNCQTVKRNLFWESFNISREYFTENVKKEISLVRSADDLVNLKDQVKNKVDKFSKIFKEITTVPVRKKNHIDDSIKEKDELSIINDNYNIAKVINKIIEKEVQNKDSNLRKIVKLMGPIGCYKNRLLEYIYICQAANLFQSKNAPIFYMDFSIYEKMDIKEIEDKFDYIVQIIEEYNNLRDTEITPLVIMDNVRTFECGMIENYNRFAVKINSLNCCVILSQDANFESRFKANNLDNSYNAYFRITDYKDKQGKLDGCTDYDFLFNITSLRMSRNKEDIRSYIKDCCNALEIEEYMNKKDEDYEEIANKLLDLNIHSMDAYQLKKILPILFAISNTVKTKNMKRYKKIVEIYCRWIKGLNIQNINNLKEKMFKYLFSKENIEYDEDFKKAVGHESLFEYLAAQYYIEKVKDIQNIDDLPEYTYSKSINFFIKSMIKNDVDVCSGFLKFINMNINDEKIYISETKLLQITYLLGRIDYNNTIDYLKQISKKINSYGEYKFIRVRLGVDISLIYKSNNMKYLSDYFKKLRDEKYLKYNDMFHLDCYGDYKWNEDNKDYKLKRGKNTLRSMLLYLKNNFINKKEGFASKDNFYKNQVVYHFLVLQHFIEKRKDQSVLENKFINDFESYKEEFRKYLEECDSKYKSSLIENLGEHWGEYFKINCPSKNK